MEHKNGGQYTREQREERRSKVSDMYFEKRLSAVKIAKVLGVNRNTVNEDIRRTYLQVGESLPEHSVSLFLSQIQKLEDQRFELENDLKNEKDFSKRIILQKIILSVNNSIAKCYEKITFHRYDVLYRLKPKESNTSCTI